MPHYKVKLSGQNFWLDMERRPQRMGFYTSRYVEAASPEEAVQIATDTLQAEGRLKPLNDPQDPPQVSVEEVEEVGGAEVPEVVPGFAFFPDELEPDA